VTAAKLLGLDAGQTAEALRLAANFASGLLECLLVGTSEYHFSVANAAPQGYLAARLAASGAKAAPQALEGHGGLYYLFGRAEREQMKGAPQAVRDRLGKEWGMPELIFKPYPMHYYNMPFLDGAAILRERHRIQPAAIRAVKLVVPPDAAGAGALNLGPYKSRDAVPGSTAFGVACMLVRGHVRVDDVNDYAAPDVLELMSRTTVTEGATMHAGSLKIITDKGAYEFDTVKDGRDYNLDLAEIESIYGTAVRATFSDEQADELLDVLRSIEERADVSDLASLMVRR
jgi:2-methylcitrate dehydratase PrpD